MISPEKETPVAFGGRLDDLRTTAAREVHQLEKELRVIVTRYEDARRVCRCFPGLIQSPLLDDVATACSAHKEVKQ